MGSPVKLNSGWLVDDAGAVAHDANDFILYDKTTGHLSYDADGNGAGAAVHFAQLSTGLDLSNADFFVF
jgi:serralysin